jgi:hypothetical protein
LRFFSRFLDGRTAACYNSRESEVLSVTTLQDLDRIVPDVIERLEWIRRQMTKYKKIDTDFRAKTLINEIAAKITQIRKVHAAYRATPSYRNKNFDNWVAMLEAYVAESHRIYEKIKAYENVKGYK